MFRINWACACQDFRWDTVLCRHCFSEKNIFYPGIRQGHHPPRPLSHVRSEQIEDELNSGLYPGLHSWDSWRHCV